MIRISRKCEYALRAVFELAVRGAGHPVKIHDIAASQNIPPRFLEVILNELRHAGLVQSRRGNAGGYMLARSPQRLTVKQVIEHIQGLIAVRAQNGERANGGRYFCGDNAFEALWASVGKTVSGICESMSFAELVASERRSKAETVADYII